MYLVTHHLNFTYGSRVIKKIHSKKGSQHSTQPDRKVSEFELEPLKENCLGIPKNSVGNSFIRNETFFNVGKTESKIIQHFHTYTTKVTGTNNKKHDHPEKWRESAKIRYHTLAKDSLNLSDIEITYFDISSFSFFS